MTKKKLTLEELKRERKKAETALRKAIEDEKMIATFFYEGKVNKLNRQIKKFKNG